MANSDDTFLRGVSELNKINNIDTTSYFHQIGRKTNILLHVGQLLMENAADTNRIVRTMRRIGIYLGIPEDKLHIHITFTTLMINISDEDGDKSITKFQKCYKHAIDMTVISAISKLSWRILEEKYSLEQIEQNLNFIALRQRFYKLPVVVFGAGVACGGFNLLFGCDAPAFVYTAVCAMIGFLVRVKCNRLDFNTYASIAISAFCASFLAYLAHFLPTSTPWHPVIACTLFIVPGIPLINAVDDLLDNFIVSGITRGMNSLLMVCSMTFGIVFAIKLCDFTDFTSVVISPNSYLICAIGAAAAAIGFSTIFNTPPRLLWFVALGAVITVGIRNFLQIECSFNQATASLIGAVTVSLISLKVVHIVHTPNLVLTIPSVIPLIPGVLIYRCLFGVINIDSLSDAASHQFLIDGVNALLTVMAIAVGAAIPNIFLRKYINQDKEKRLYEIIRRQAAKP